MDSKTKGVSCPVCGSVRGTRQQRGPHIGLFCENCGRYLKWVPQPWQQFTMPFGKHKGHRLADVVRDDREYVEWCAENLQRRNTRHRCQEALAATTRELRV